MPAQPLSEEQLADAARLKQLFAKWRADVKEKTGRKMSQNDASEFFEFSQSALSQYLNGAIPLNIKAATAFAHVLGVDMADFSPALAAEFGNLVASQAHATGKAKFDGEPDDAGMGRVRTLGSGLLKIPHINLKLSAGVTGFQSDSDGDDGNYAEVSEAWVRKHRYDIESLRSFVAKGESMRDRIADGDRVIGNLAERKLISGKVFIIRYDGELMIKRMVKEGPMWWVTCDNQSDPKRYGRRLCRGENCVVLARVVQVISSNPDEI
ncbi:MAG TPA: LexA family transcriptional regulator [Burkholderiaceae bacterium]